jgi:hypothetical protein
MIEQGEIVFCNLTIINNGKKEKINRVVYKEVNGLYKGNRVLDIEIISKLGFENRVKGYDVGIKNDEKRNNITGAYE